MITRHTPKDTFVILHNIFPHFLSVFNNNMIHQHLNTSKESSSFPFTDTEYTPKRCFLHTLFLRMTLSQKNPSLSYTVAGSMNIWIDNRHLISSKGITEEMTCLTNPNRLVDVKAIISFLFLQT